MSQAHLDAFLADLRRVNPRINIDGYVGVTSVQGLISHLRTTVSRPIAMTVNAAVRCCANPRDRGIDKYRGAIGRLTSVWATNNPYPASLGAAQVPAQPAQVPAQPQAPAQTAQAAAQAAQAEEQAAQAEFGNLPNTFGIGWQDLHYNADPFTFGMQLGRGFVHRTGQHIDITSRSLLLKAGLTPPTESQADNGYIDRLALTQVELNAMRGGSILDIGCGAAMFGAEMKTLYGCTTTGMDLHANTITGTIMEEVTTRYKKSMLYLKLKKELGKLDTTRVPSWTSTLVDDLIQRMYDTILYFTYNPPRQGDVNELSKTSNTTRYDFCVSMFLLGYFRDTAAQTKAVRNICSVTNRTIFLNSGGGNLANLIYDQAAIRTEFPGATIAVKNEYTHHIDMSGHTATAVTPSAAPNAPP